MTSLNRDGTSEQRRWTITTVRNDSRPIVLASSYPQELVGCEIVERVDVMSVEEHRGIVAGIECLEARIVGMLTDRAEVAEAELDRLREAAQAVVDAPVADHEDGPAFFEALDALRSVLAGDKEEQ